MNIIGIPPHVIFDVFPMIKPWLTKMVNRTGGENDEYQLARDVLSGSKQMWVARTDEICAVALTRIYDHPVKVVEIAYCTGEGREDWADAMVDEIEKWAHEIGAQKLRTINRPGWVGFLKKRGLRETHRIMELTYGA
jgi:hypothetical protein